MPRSTLCFFFLLLASVSAQVQNLRATPRRLVSDPSSAPSERPPSPCECFCEEGDDGYNIIAAANSDSVLHKIWNYGTGEHSSGCVEYEYSFEYDAVEVTDGIPTNAGYCDMTCMVPSTSPTTSPAPSSSEPPSYSPSISLAPSKSPAPSVNPSEAPSKSPTVSPAPTTSPKPSIAPSISAQPSMSPSVCVGTYRPTDGCFSGPSDCVTIGCAQRGLACCTGSNACVWPASSASMVVCPNSCNGRNACKFTMTGLVATIYEDSCNGLDACKDLGLGGTDFTSTAVGTASVSRVEAHSCDGALACMRKAGGRVGSYSCRGINSCTLVDESVGNNVRRLNPLPEGVEDTDEIQYE